ncbi:MAG: ABC transporter ATP-binding protein/permease [Turicibacter sp.]|nr:ABC transporter ATP-binding protein/permease [Turicibacter sp.]
MSRPMGPGGPGGSPGHGARFHKAEKVKNPKSTIKRLIAYMGHKKYALIGVFIFCIISTVVSVLATNYYGRIIDDYIIPGDLSGLKNICIFIALIYLIGAGTTYSQNLIMLKIAQETSAEIRRQLFNAIQKLPLRFFDTNSSGDLMSRLTNDVDNINMTLSQSVTQMFSGVITIIGMLIAMIILSPMLTIVGLLTTPFMFFSSRFLVKKTQPFFVKQQRDLGSLNGYIEEIVSGQKAVLLFSQEETVEQEFGKINRRLTKSVIMAQALSGWMGPINNFINNLTYLLIAVVGGILALKTSSITVGNIFVFILYMRNFTKPINEILNIFNTVQSALAGAERVFEIMDEVPEQDAKDAHDVEKLDGDVILNHVKFSYDENKTILKDACIHAYRGETVAIVGPTGAGKTTIINLLTKFYDIDSGEILIDGENINQMTRRSLRRSISMVLQDTYLFSETVRENIRYGRLDATDDEIIEAAQMANAHNFIMQLPDGYDTVLADNGGNLSQGQRQLLAIARAVLSQASILILDEATSSIDTRTEVEIQKAMLRLMEGKTTFVIAHRLSTIRNADQILVLNQGEIIEQGNHETLLAANGFYANLYHSQFRE